MNETMKKKHFLIMILDYINLNSSSFDVFFLLLYEYKYTFSPRHHFYFSILEFNIEIRMKFETHVNVLTN